MAPQGLPGEPTGKISRNKAMLEKHQPLGGQYQPEVVLPAQSTRSAPSPQSNTPEKALKPSASIFPLPQL